MQFRMGLAARHHPGDVSDRGSDLTPALLRLEVSAYLLAVDGYQLTTDICIALTVSCAVPEDALLRPPSELHVPIRLPLSDRTNPTRSGSQASFFNSERRALVGPFVSCSILRLFTAMSIRSAFELLAPSEAGRFTENHTSHDEQLKHIVLGGSLAWHVCSFERTRKWRSAPVLCGGRRWGWVVYSMVQ